MTTQTSTDTSRDLAALEVHWRRFGVRRASQQSDSPAATTGWPALDRLLPGGGYPRSAVTELMVSHVGIGEVSLLLPSLAARARAQPQRRIAFISPPCRLNAPALAAAGIDCRRVPIVACASDGERVWCVEQMAGSRAFCAFVVWSDTLDARALRRLQLAAEQAACPLFVFRPLHQAGQRSPAALRLALTGQHKGQAIEIVKCRGPAGARTTGLAAARDMAWQMTEPAYGAYGSSIRRRQRADNDAPPDCQASIDRHNVTDTSHVARTAFSPLGPR